MSVTYTVSELAELVGGALRGDGSARMTGVSAIGAAKPDQLAWLTDAKHAGLLEKCRAGAILVPTAHGPTPMPAILCDRPEEAVARALDLFAPPVPHPPRGIHPTALIDPSAELGKDVAIGPYVIVEAGAHIGDRTVLHAGISIGAEAHVGSDCLLWHQVIVRERCVLGDRVIAHPHVVIGSDGFGYYQRDGRHQKVTHGGWVEVGDDVEIGAGSCIDRAKFGATTIGRGTKIDNLVQIGHNVTVGEHCLIVAQVGIAGSTRLGNYVVLAGQVGLRDHITLGDRVTVAACSCVSKDVAAGVVVSGITAIENRRHLREQAAVHRLPETVALIRELAVRVEQLEAAANDRQAG